MHQYPGPSAHVAQFVNAGYVPQSEGLLTKPFVQPADFATHAAGESVHQDAALDAAHVEQLVKAVHTLPTHDNGGAQFEDEHGGAVHALAEDDPAAAICTGGGQGARKGQRAAHPAPRTCTRASAARVVAQLLPRTKPLGVQVVHDCVMPPADHEY